MSLCKPPFRLLDSIVVPSAEGVTPSADAEPLYVLQSELSCDGSQIAVSLSDESIQTFAVGREAGVPLTHAQSLFVPRGGGGGRIPNSSTLACDDTPLSLIHI